MFNLMVGTGALTMPAAFANAGWVASLVVVVILCFVSYMTTTFIIECMSSANAVLKHKRSDERNKGFYSQINSMHAMNGRKHNSVFS